VNPQVFGTNSSIGAALLVNVRSKYFALTFGTGRSLLVPDCWEEKFGLKVTLNSVGEDTLRSMEKDSLDPLLRHTQEQTSRDANAREFGFDIEHFLGSLDQKTISPQVLRNRKILSIDENGAQLHEWSAFECLYAELTHNQDSYLLSGANGTV